MMQNEGRKERQKLCLVSSSLTKCQEEDVEISEDARVLLTKIGVNTSLRYTIHLITSAALACQKWKGKVVEVEDITRVYNLFYDMKRSTQYLMEYQSHYMFKEISAGEAEEDETTAMDACGLSKKSKEQIVDIDAADVNYELAVLEYVEDIFSFYKLAESETRVHD
ncbi:putative cyclin-D4-1-like [Capsicum annuum]|nr:putative cyclin-D4-1-like [Capsicum annuum]